ncbi:MAG TPA: leucyl/phenylalanyl-tRNA--protein transferase [Pirellulales bacterium]|nr:leucyl/phenylalanyl-tRNA--protein transferase [Pirellulales bacterium]
MPPIRHTRRPSPEEFFVPPELASPEGLVGVGGSLHSEWLLYAYRHGIFPWPAESGPLAWWSPDPRAIFELDALRVSRSLARTVRGGKFRVTCDREFAGVMAGCATAQRRARGTWLTPAMRAAYGALHALGHAHSIEVWHADQLAGGVYGVAIGGLFAAESMFYFVRDASKVALVHLLNHLRSRGYTLLDIQQLTPHTARLGAREIPRREFLDRLARAVEQPLDFGLELAPLA